jgi:hypothetical protein
MVLLGLRTIRRVVGLSFIWVVGITFLVGGLVLAKTGHSGYKLACRSHWVLDLEGTKR